MPGRLFVAAVAAGVGDTNAAGGLADSIPDDVDEIIGTEVLRVAALAVTDVLARTEARLGLG